MRRVIVGIAITLLGVAITTAVLVSLEEDRPTFDEGDAEVAFQMAIDRCSGPRFEGEVACERVAEGFACRAEGGYHGTFEMPDAEQPEIALVC